MWGRSFDLSSQATDGSRYNREHVNDDRDGVLLGFALDGFGDTTHVRSMLSMGGVPLLILVNRRYLADLESAHGRPGAPANGASAPAIQGNTSAISRPTFDKIAAHARREGTDQRDRFYLGPRGSGTREMSMLVLSEYGVPVEWVDTRAESAFTDFCETGLR